MQIKNLGQENGFWFQLNFEASPPILIISDPKTQKQEYIFGKLSEDQRFHFAMNRLIPGVTIEIDEYSSVNWLKNEKIHRENGPARLERTGTKMWIKNGKCHREDGPAVVYWNGTKQWFKNGELHREDGPTVVSPDGKKYWYLHNKQFSEQEWKNLIKAKQNAD